MESAVANALKTIWQSGGTAVNGWLAIPNGYTAELMALGGWDSLTVDLQHGLQDYMSMLHCFQAMQAHPVMPMVRVPSNEPGIIGKALDAGAYGVICPMVNTAEQAEAFVAAASYPPAGQRSNGPTRAALYGPSTGYQKTANAETLRIPMIETRQAVENLDAILSVPGVDAVYIGPSDLGFSLGLPPVLDREEPQILEIYDRVIRAARERGIAAGVHCLTPAYARRMIAMGFRLVTAAADNLLIRSGAQAAVAATRAA